MEKTPAKPLLLVSTLTVSEATSYMTAKKQAKSIIVNSSNIIIGMLTDKEITEQIVANGMPANTTIDSVLLQPLSYITTSSKLLDALELMVEHRVNSLFVFQDIYPTKEMSVGTITLNNCFEILKFTLSKSTSLLECSFEIQPNLNAFIGLGTNVREASALLKANNTTALCVLDNNHVVGIVTSNDITLRVLAAGLDANDTSIYQIMTPHPDIVSSSITVLEGIDKMIYGNYSHLPIVDDLNNFQGMLDGIQFAFVVVQKINQFGVKLREPVWNTVLRSDESDVHETQVSYQYFRPLAESQFISEYNDDPLLITPDDSVSKLNVTVDSIPIEMEKESEKNINFVGLPSNTLKQAQPSENNKVVEDMFLFKVHDTVQGNTYRFSAPFQTMKLLTNIISSKMQNKSFEFVLSYVDDEGDTIGLQTDRDLQDAVKLSRSAGLNLIKLNLSNKHTNSTKRRSVSNTPMHVKKNQVTKDCKDVRKSKENNPEVLESSYIGIVILAAGCSVALIAAFLMKRFMN